MNYDFKFTYRANNKIKTAVGANDDFNLEVKEDKNQ